MTEPVSNVPAIQPSADEVIARCMDPFNPGSFFLYAGAGTGKTRSLVDALEAVRARFSRASISTGRRSVSSLTPMPPAMRSSAGSISTRTFISRPSIAFAGRSLGAFIPTSALGLKPSCRSISPSRERSWHGGAQAPKRRKTASARSVPRPRVLNASTASLPLPTIRTVTTTARTPCPMPKCCRSPRISFRPSRSCNCC
jgi:hypothetical protein